MKSCYHNEAEDYLSCAALWNHALHNNELIEIELTEPEI